MSGIMSGPGSLGLMLVILKISVTRYFYKEVKKNHRLVQYNGHKNLGDSQLLYEIKWEPRNSKPQTSGVRPQPPFQNRTEELVGVVEHFD